MCGTCGCGDDGSVTITNLTHGQMDHSHRHDEAGHDAHAHAHTHGEHTHTHSDGEHAHAHTHDAHAHTHDTHAHTHDAHSHTQVGSVIELEAAILEKNNLLAERNRGWFSGREILALNVVSSPGAGKTTLLARTICDRHEQFNFHVIEGDQATLNDAERIRAAGAPVIQINTGTGCHLEANMIADGLGRLAPPPGAVVLIENVGNLVCPALFDLGERKKVAIISVTEGDDKPSKYPHMFRASELLIINKIDLLPYVNFSVDACVAAALDINPDLEVLTVSATTGAGLDDWYRWLERERTELGGVSLGASAT